MEHHIEIRQKVLYENQKQDLRRSRKLQHRRLGPFTVIKRITETTYQITDGKDPTVIKTVQRKNLVEYYLKEGSQLAMVEEYVPPDHQNDSFYERFMEQRIRDLKRPSTTEKHDSFPFPKEPLRSFSSTNKPRRSSMYSNDSRITSHICFFSQPFAITCNSYENFNPHLSSSQHAQTAKLSPREHL